MAHKRTLRPSLAATLLLVAVLGSSAQYTLQGHISWPNTTAEALEYSIDYLSQAIEKALDSDLEVIHGRIVGITDGDTVKLQTANKQEIRVRLYGIDSPEQDQPHGKEATKALAKLLRQQQVTAEVIDTDRYGRLVARLFVGQDEINHEMIKQGHAWFYKQYASSWHLRLAQYQAQYRQSGLWALPAEQRIPPWEWRRDEGAVYSDTLAGN